jgi:hypothetical protein
MSVLIWFNSLLVLENDTCEDGSECVIVIIVFRYVIYIVTKFIKKKRKKKKKRNANQTFILLI